jgi:hypothetical protein
MWLGDPHPLDIRGTTIEKEEHLDLIAIIPWPGMTASANMSLHTAAVLIATCSKIDRTKAAMSPIVFRSEFRAEGDAGRI